MIFLFVMRRESGASSRFHRYILLDHPPSRMMTKKEKRE